MIDKQRAGSEQFAGLTHRNNTIEERLYETDTTNELFYELKQDKEEEKIIKKVQSRKAGPIDLSAGLISIQGHYLFHFSCFVLTYFVRQAQEDMTCSDVGIVASKPIVLNTDEKFLLHSMNLNETLIGLRVIHFLCFIMLLLLDPVNGF